MQKLYRLFILCLALICCGQLVGDEKGFGACPLFLKPAFELTDKDQILLDIVHQDVVSSRGDFTSLVEVNGRYPEAFEQALACYLDEMRGRSSTRVNYQNAIRKSSEYLATLLFPVQEEAPETQNGEISVSGADCVALLIGINYEGTRNVLQSCIRDIDHVFGFLLAPYIGVKHENVIYMSDRKRGTPFYPTRENILRQFNNFTRLVNQTKFGYFHYSGHGTSVLDPSKDERDGGDEALVPVDFDTNGVLVDDDIYLTLIRGLNSDVELLVTADCCHSGTILDLPYKWKADGSYTLEHNLSRAELNSLPRVVLLSGCRDDQTSMDIGAMGGSYHVDPNDLSGVLDSEGSGALTAAFLRVLAKHDYDITYRQLIQEVTNELASKGYKQRPELTSSYLMNLDDHYLINPNSAKHIFTSN